MSAKNTFYVTTPIYYVTAKPHLGSLYSTLIADVIARWNALCGREVFFLTGTDEHGQKIALAANQMGMQPKSFVDSFVPAYLDTWSAYNIQYSRFIRTTDTTHIKAAQKLVDQLVTQGDIYKDIYNGWYCTPCETFITGKDVSGQEVPACPSCGRSTSWLSEATYFFRLSAYQEKLLELYRNNPDFVVPKERLHEVINFVESGLKDVSISRTSVEWGIPFPHDPSHTIYVWIEALANYITAIGYADTSKEREFQHWWPANLQILGKDIIRFHAVYWPALLMAAGLAIPKKLLVHGWIKVNSQKMSKSLGNVVDPIELKNMYGVDAVRYYLLRYLPISHDGDFHTADLERAIENDLANDLSNLLNRMVSLAHQHGVSELSAPAIWNQAALDLRNECWDMVEDVDMHMQEYQFHVALARVWHTIKLVNGYFHEHQPWKLAKTERETFLTVLSAVAHSLSSISYLLDPFMPTKMAELRHALGVSYSRHENIIEYISNDYWHTKFILTKADYLFQRIMTEQPMQSEKKVAVIPSADTSISIDDFKKVELVIGTVTECIVLEESDKLLKLQVDFGLKGTRQILTGLKKFYTPHDLIGKQLLFIFNLQPRKIMGYESHGMLLTVADPHGNPQLLWPSNVVVNGGLLQ